MNWKRTLVAVGLLAAVVAAYQYAEDAAGLVLWQQYSAGSYSYDLLFESRTWLLPAAVAAGGLLGALHGVDREDVSTERSGLVKRHDTFGSFLEHWTVVAGMALLILSGVWLGFLFVPRLAATTETVGLAMNVHWAGTVLLLFAVTYHAAALVMGDHRSILPGRGDLRASFEDIGHYLRLTEAPEAEKYLPIQKVSYVIWAVLLGVVGVTGLVKAADYVGTVSSGTKAAATLVHDVFALFTILFLAVHVAVVFMPSHLQLLRSQVTGWIPREYVREHHPRWDRELGKR